MNALLLRNLGGLRRSSSLQSFAEYRQAEAQNPQMSSVTSEGTLLEYETLELRIHPPNVVIDNETYDDVTVITIDSANRPGTLIEVVQCLTELGLSIRCARISSDGGWFVDEFFVTETPKGKMLDQRKMNIIRKVLSVETDSAGNFKDKEICTVFELAGRDRHGLLAAVLQLLVVNGCEVLSAAVWTFHDRVALVLSATERGAPVVDPVKLDRLEQILYDMLGGGDAVVNSELVRGEVHHERRLHHLLLLEELKAWEQQYVASSVTPTHGSTTPIQGAATPTYGTSSQPNTQNGCTTTAAGGGGSNTPTGAEGTGGPGAMPPVFAGFARASFNAGTTVSVNNSCLPSRAPSPAPGFAAGHSGLQREGSGGVGGVPGYTPAGFPQADEGGAACPQAAALAGASSGGGGDMGLDCLTAAPAGPFDLSCGGGGLGRCTSAEGALGPLGVGNHSMMVVSEPLIDVGLDLPAAVQLQDHVAAAMERQQQRSAPPTDLGMVPSAPPGQQPVSPTAAAAAAADGSGGGAGKPYSRTASTSSATGMVMSRGMDVRTQASTSGGGAGPGGAAPQRGGSGRMMTVTGDEHETGQQPLAPAPTAVPPSLGNADAAAAAGGGGAAGGAAAGGASAQDQLAQLRRSEVRIQHSALLNYWLVTIRCRDRNKLFFDTVCTLADMNYDIYHATIDSEGDAASQLFYVRPRYGECIWDERRAAKLRYMLESAVQRRFPRGTKVCVQSNDRSALVQLFSALSSGGFWITRADVRTHQEAAVFEFTITDTRGHLPEQSHVQRICEAVGGTLAHDVYGPSHGLQPGSSGSRLGGSSGRGSAGVGGAGGGGVGTFRFSILERRWNKGWQGGIQGNAAGSYDSAVSSGSM